MDFYKSSLYIYKFKFPMRKEYISTIGDYKKKLNQGLSFINNEFSKLLKKSKEQEIEDERKKKYILLLKLLEEKKQKKIKSEINKKKQIEKMKKITKSISNNNMLLNQMSCSKLFIKYLNSKKQIQSRNNNISYKNSTGDKYDISVLKTQNNKVRTFMTEIPKFNFSRNKNNKNNSVTSKSRILKFKNNSNLKNLKEKFLNIRNKTMRTKNFSANNVLITKTVMIPKYVKPKIMIQIPNNKTIKQLLNK